MKTFCKKYSLHEAVGGLMAWELGFRDSGINDPKLALEVKEYFQKMDSTEFRRTTAKLAQKMFLSDEKIDEGYGLEDVRGLMNFLNNLLGYDAV